MQQSARDADAGEPANADLLCDVEETEQEDGDEDGSGYTWQTRVDAEYAALPVADGARLGVTTGYEWLDLLLFKPSTEMLLRALVIEPAHYAAQHKLVRHSVLNKLCRTARLAARANNLAIVVAVGFALHIFVDELRAYVVDGKALPPGAGQYFVVNMQRLMTTFVPNASYAEYSGYPVAVDAHSVAQIGLALIAMSCEGAARAVASATRM